MKKKCTSVIRRGGFILAALAALSAPAVTADYPLQPAPAGNVKVDGGFWGPRLTINAKVTVPHNHKFLENSGRMAVFDRAAGTAPKDPGSDMYVVDSDVFKIIEGAAFTLQQRPDEIDLADLARQVQRVIAAREKDGFLCPRVTLKDPKSRWENLHKSHVLYSAGHLFEAGVAWKEATGKDDLLQASTRYADLIAERFGPGKVRDVPGHQGIEMALVRLYRATGERRYLDLGKFFLDQRGHGKQQAVDSDRPHPDDYNQNRVPLVDAQKAVGHAVRAGYTYAAMADVAALYGDSAYKQALDRLWQDVVGRKLYITGASATAQYYDEGFGDPYHLPNDTAYCETCGTISTVFWSHRMALLHEDAQYIDVLERALYNGVLSGISLSGDEFFYKNPLASRGKVGRDESWNPACCQSNLVRVIPQVGALAYATDADTAFVNLFVNGTATLDLGDGPVVLNMGTEYPRDGRIRITVVSGPDKPVTIALRIPGWAREQPVPSDLYRFAATSDQQPSLTVGGQPVALAGETSVRKGYVHLKRIWKKGETVELNLPMPVRRVLAHDKVEADRGRVALQRGPLVYCVEAIDNGNLRTDALVLPDSTRLKAERRKGLLGDVVTITGTAAVASEPQPGKPAELRPHPIVAIPYYAWANRDDGYMDIWLARAVATATPISAPTAGAVAKVSASVKRSSKELLALNDRRVGPNSRFRPTPRFICPQEPSNDGGPWIQYEWDEARELNETAVYWALDQPKKVYWGERVRGTLLKLPESWQLLYKDGDAWVPVRTKDDYPLKPDQMNRIRFTPVKTKAVRLRIVPADAACAIQEWSVN